MNEREILSNYVYRMVASLVQNGVEQVVVSPGSRSTPLAYAFAQTKNLKLFRQIDERSAGFFALGLAKASAKPVVLLCTSGTAAANYYPAIVEAKYARVPLIVITADRPHELREVGAPQAINQIGLYGEHVKWSAEFPIPDNAKPTLPFIERHTARAVGIAITAPMGPVHINVPFREPLLVDFTDLPSVSFQQSFVSELAPSKQGIAFLQEAIGKTDKGLLVIGELPLGTDLSYVWAFIRKCKWPVVLESLSNMRSSIPVDCLPYTITTYDAILKNERFKKEAAPHTVIRFGAQPVSKFLSIFITESLPECYIVIDEDPMFRDSTSLSTHFIHAKVGEWLAHIDSTSASNEAYKTLWQKANSIALDLIHDYRSKEQDEGALVSRLLHLLPNKSDIFASSSMPIRDIDTFFCPMEKDIQIYANRGANGIDGVISTALGFSKSRENRPTYLLIGDLAFLHDINAFIATRYQSCDLTIIVMNNDGGGIFSYLPQASVEEHYEDLFGTPTSLTFASVASMYGMEYKKTTTAEEFELAIGTEKNKDIRLIEAITNRSENVVAHRNLWQSINTELDEWLS